MTEQRGLGRPSDYNEDIATTICDRLADGESLRAICASAGMPAEFERVDRPDR